MNVPDMGMKKIVEEIAFRRALERAIGRGVSMQRIAQKLHTVTGRVEFWRKGDKLPDADYCSAIAPVIDAM